MSKSVAFIVDGDLEKNLLQNVCKGAAIRKIGNGDGFPTHVIIKQIMTLVRALNNRYEHVAILYDREDRTTSAENFATEIRDALIAAGIGEQAFSVHIKDREVEDWILADPECLEAFLGSRVDVSGLRGKAGLSGVLKAAGRKYSEVAIGTDLLKSVVCSKACERSDSLARFRADFPKECWWLER